MLGAQKNKLDTLNRQPFVEQVFNLIETISANKGNTTFAINGNWGCGKSFVLDLLEEKLKETQCPETADNKYFVIKYNCWQYDFYEEPLIAFVSTVIDNINSNKLIADETKRTSLLNILKHIGVGILNIGNNLIKNQTGIDVKQSAQPLVAATKELKKDTKEQLLQVHQFDNFYTFKEQINKLREELIKISDNQTIIIVVDELDRCLPEYAIKVLERLHHITEDLPNTITIIATDKDKMNNIVKGIYGFESKDTASIYLKKFINFEIQLDNGINNEKVLEKYADYIEQFKHSLLDCDLTDFVSTLFKGISPREQEQLMEKAQITHKLLAKSAFDQTVLCAELTLVVLDKYYKIPNILNGIRTRFLDNPLGIDFKNSGLGDFQNKISTAKYRYVKSQRFGDFYYITSGTDVYGLMLWYLNAILPEMEDYPNIFLVGKDAPFATFKQNNLQFIRSFANTLKLIN